MNINKFHTNTNQTPNNLNMATSDDSTYESMLEARYVNGDRLFPDFTQSVNAELESFYKQLANKTRDTDFTRAFSQMMRFVPYLESKFPECSITTRETPKTCKRFDAKLAMTTRPDCFFKAHCDFIALRVVTEDVGLVVSTFPAFLTELVKEYSGQFAARPSYQNQPDLVYFYYVYIPQYKYVMEIQVIHPFAARVFTADSQRNAGMDAPDYWENDFYTSVKKNLLATSLTMQQMYDVLKPTLNV